MLIFISLPSLQRVHQKFWAASSAMTRVAACQPSLQKRRAQSSKSRWDRPEGGGPEWQIGHDCGWQRWTYQDSDLLVLLDF